MAFYSIDLLSNHTNIFAVKRVNTSVPSRFRLLELPVLLARYIYHK